MNTDVIINNEVDRYDYPMILAQNRVQAVINPVRLRYNAAGYAAGQVLARNTGDDLYEKYDSGGASGTDVAAAILLFPKGAESFQPQVASGSTIARAVFGGLVYKDKLVDLDSDAEDDLGARTIKDATGIEILKF